MEALRRRRIAALQIGDLAQLRCVGYVFWAMSTAKKRALQV